MAKFCFNCGAPLEGTPKFCPSCGTALAASAPAQPQRAAPPPPPISKAPPAHQTITAPPPPRTQSAPPASQQQMPYNPQYQAPPAQQPMMVQQSAMPQTAVRQPPVPPPTAQQPGQSYYNGAFGGNSQPYPGQNMTPSPGFAAYGNEPYIPDEGLAAKFFRYDNRLNRKRYILRGLALVGIYVVASLIFGTLGMMISQTVGTALIWLAGLAIMVPSVMLLIRRLHDLDRPGWWAVGGFIPALNIALSIYVLCVPGTPGPNQYGPDPLTVQN